MRISDWSSDVCSSDLTPSKIKSVLEAAVGAGIEDNMIDCYAQIISYYEPGDRIVLVGFSRGAYTVRALANMMNLCGVPTQRRDGAPSPGDGPTLSAGGTEEGYSVYTPYPANHRDKRTTVRKDRVKGRRIRAQ